MTARTDRYALLFRRVGAYLLDMLLLFAVLAPLAWLLQFMMGWTPTGREIWYALLVSFSLPTWLYFIGFESSRAGATPGKRLAGVRVALAEPGGSRRPRVVVRTAIKLIPWEVVHLASFGLASPDEPFTRLQTGGLALGWILILVYLAWAVMSRGRVSVHDRAAGTCIERAVSAAE